jgi:hypothetical protein
MTDKQDNVRDLMRKHTKEAINMRAHALEGLCKAYVDEHQVDPQDCVLIEQDCGDGTRKWWIQFDPHRNRQAEAVDECRRVMSMASSEEERAHALVNLSNETRILKGMDR